MASLRRLLEPIFSSSIARQASLYTLANLLNAAIPFLLLPVMTRYLHPRDYGIIAMFQILTSVTSIFVGLNTHGAVSRQYFERDSIRFPEYVSNCLLIFIISAVIFSVGVVCFGGVLQEATQFPSAWMWSVGIVASLQFLQSMALTVWQIRGKAISYLVFQVLMTGLNLLLSVVLVVWMGFDWEGRVLAQVITSIIFGCLAVYFLYRQGLIVWKFNASYLRHALYFGLPLVPHALSGMAILMTDRLLLTNMVGVEVTGLYVVGAQIGMIIGFLEDAFNKAWVPFYLDKMKVGTTAAKLTVVKITYVYMAGLAVLALCLGLLAPWFCRVFLGASFEGSAKYVLLLALGNAFSGMYKMFSNAFFFANRTSYLAIATVTTAILNGILCYLLIQSIGEMGAALGTMIAYMISFLLTWIISSRILPMPWTLRASS